MVRTRRSSETAGFSTDGKETRLTRRKESVEIREVHSSDESGLETKPMSSKRRRLHSKEAIVNEGEGKAPKSVRTPEPRTFSPLKTGLKSRSVKNERDGASCSTSRSQARKVRSRSNSMDRQRLRRTINENPKLVVSLDENSIVQPSIRRSCRERRGVYDTLNVRMLTDHRYVHPTFESVNEKEDKGERKRKFLEVQTDSASEEEAINMYDKVKRKHDTPSPEKRDSRREEDEEEEDSDDDDDDDDDDEEGEDEDEDPEEHRNHYLLRKKKPVINRYTAPPMSKNKKDKKAFHIAMRQGRHRHDPPPHASPIRRFRAHKRKAMNMSSSTSSEGSCDEQNERTFERRKNKSMAKARNRALPINLTIEDISKGILRDRERIGSSLADVDPMSVDKKVMFDSVGGLGKQIRALKEMILFPLMYPEVFEKFKISPPRGVLFFGPPGTGKTLVARALANECSQGDKKVSFFMRKGADCLSKWVGESERQLRLLFDQAYAMRPSIIFFDEIDGLAPVRSSRQDQIHSSIVSTLLALMDGLDSRGEVVVIGATNRIDAIDPALRRPGRFDREFQFPLPDRNSRRSILSIHTREWEPKLSQSFINELADFCVGYCGADIKALCTEAALFALRRSYPQVYNSSKKLLLDLENIEVTYKDFFNATKSIVPAHQRSVASPARALSGIIKPLLDNTFSQAMKMLVKRFPPAQTKTAAEQPSSQHTKQLETLSDDDLSSDGDDAPNIYDNTNPTTTPAGSSRRERYMRRMIQRHEMPNAPQISTKTFSFSEELFKGPVTYRPRLLLAGREGMGQSTHLAPALLHSIEHLSVHCLDLPALYGVASRTPEEACAQLFREARRSSPCVVYMPHLSSLWLATSDSLHATLMSLLLDLPPLVPVLLLATADRQFHELPEEIQQLFAQETCQVLNVCSSNTEERRSFFHAIFLEYALQRPKAKKKRRSHTREVLPFAPSPPSRQLSEAELRKIQQNEENTMRELRIFLRDVNHKLIIDRRFKEFSKPVDLEEVNDYLEVVDEPMDLSTMMEKIDRHQYSTCAQYLLDVDLITSNALKYNPDRDPLDKIIRHRACELRDMANSLIKSQLEPEFEKACEEIVASRERRGEKSSAVAPAYVFTAPRTKTSTPRPPPDERPQQQHASSLNTAVPQSVPTTGALDSAAASTSTGRSTESGGSKSSKKKKRPYGARRRRYRRRQLTSELNEEGEKEEQGEDEDEEEEQEEEQDEEEKEGKGAKDDFMDDHEVKGNSTTGAHDDSMESCESLTDKELAVCAENLDETATADDTGKVFNGDEMVDISIPENNQEELLNSDNKEISSNNRAKVEHVRRSLSMDDISGHSRSEVEQNGEVHASSDEGQENNDVQTPPRDRKDPPSPFRDGKDPPSPCRDIEMRAHSAKKHVQFEEVNGLSDGLSTSISGEHIDGEGEISAKQDVEVAERLEEDIDDSQADTAKCSHENESRWKHKLEQLLTWLVEMTAGSTVETLERFHNSLQLCVHHHRHKTDKEVLIQELEDMLTGWSRSCSTTPCR